MNDIVVMQPVVVADVEIRRDAEGRYCLNDLHRASGGEKRHGPSYWLGNAQTQELVQELSVPGIPGTEQNQGLRETTGIPVVTLEGVKGGTYVCKELVYAYAMWISPTFHLKVIRTFDAVVNQPKFALSDFNVPTNLRDALLLAADLEEARMKAEKKAEEAERTKAWIGSKREATAMATAATYKGKCLLLEQKIDEVQKKAATDSFLVRALAAHREQESNKDFYTLRCVANHKLLPHDGMDISWRVLSDTSKKLGLPIRKVSDPYYVEVNAYHRDVWKEAYGVNIPRIGSLHLTDPLFDGRPQ